MSQNLLHHQPYRWGFSTDIETEVFPKGLNEQIIRQISQIKGEPEWMLEIRLKAYRHWLTLQEPTWAEVSYEKPQFQELRYYAAPKKKPNSPKTLEELDPELLKTFERLGIPLSEQKRISGVAMDLVFDSVSVAQTQQEELEKLGVIFCSITEAIQKYPEMVKKYFATVVPYSDNYYAALNTAVFSDGSFVYIPKGVRCPIDLSTYFRINAKETGQFERTLIIADEGSFVNYLEGCTAPQRDEYQLHAAVVELVALDQATINYSTVQNWYTGDKEGHGGVYNFVTKRGKCQGYRSKISWTQVESGSAVTWKYPSCVLLGEESEGEFYSVALTHDYMQADTGSKMIHIGKNTKSRIISKGISTGHSTNIYRGLVKFMPSAVGARNYSQCDSMLVGPHSRALTIPYIEVKNPQTIIEHEASTSRVSEEQLFYLQSRGLSQEQAISMVVHGFCREVFQHLPLEFSVEAVKLIEMKLEHSVG